MIPINDFDYLCLCFGKYRRRRIQRNAFPKRVRCCIPGCGKRFELRNFEDYVQRQYYLNRGQDVVRRSALPMDAKNDKLRWVCRDCDLRNKVRVAAGTLRQLISAVPVAERDRLGIYPNQVPVPYGWKQRLPDSGIRDYAEPGPIGIRQKAASAVRDVLSITSPLVDLPAAERRLALYFLGRLPSPETQRTLKHWRRLYKGDCWSPYIDGGSFGQLRSAYLHPEHASKRGWRWWIGEVDHPPRNHAELISKQAEHNEQHGSFWNHTSINHRGRVGRIEGYHKVPSETLIDQRSLNIPKENVVARNIAIETIEQDFVPQTAREAAA